MRRIAITLALLLPPVLALPATAGAITFGADLAASAPTEGTSTCAAAPPSRLVPVGSPSCMWSYLGSGTNTLAAPATGVVDTVRVRVGSTTGPMRVNVIRFLFQQTGNTSTPSSAGPFLQAYGPQFTPQANAVTTIAANLPMKTDPTPVPTDLQTIQVIDALALEVEAPNVPVPIFPLSGALTYPVYPGPTAQGLAAPSANALASYTTIGGGVLMSADLTPGGTTPNQTPDGGTTTGPGTPGNPALQLRRATAPVSRGVAGLPLTCVGADCAGTLTLLREIARTAATKPRKTTTVVLGRATFSIKAGAKTTVKVKLNRAGRAVVKRRARTKVKARVAFSRGAAKTATLSVTLKR